jgi:hypothetical protein
MVYDDDDAVAIRCKNQIQIGGDLHSIQRFWMGRTANNRKVQSRLREECCGPDTTHFPFPAALGDRKSGDRASGVEFALVLTMINPRPRDPLLRSLDDPALRIRIPMSSIEVRPDRIMRRSHTPFLKGVLNTLVGVVVRLKVSPLTEINDIPEFGGGTTGGHLDNSECVDISLTDATEMGNDSVHSFGEQKWD